MEVIGGFYIFARVEKTTTNSAIKAKNKNDILRLEASAKKPITGGPTKKPTKLMVLTAAIAGPGCMVVLRPAALYTSGTTLDIPAPTSISPTMAGTSVGKMTAISIPLILRSPLTCSVVFNPNRAENASATKRPPAIVHMPAV